MEGMLMDEINRCPICGLNGGDGCLCYEHAIKINDFNWLKIYINNLESFDKKVLYVIESSISNRKSFVINSVEIFDGKLQIEKYLHKSDCSQFMERILKEILALEKAKGYVVEILKEKGEL